MYKTIAVITSDISGQTAHFVDRIDVQKYTVTVITYNKKRSQKKWLRKKLIKTLKVGILGMYFNRFLLPKKNLKMINRNVDIIKFDSLNCIEMIEHLKRKDYDLGISLGNSYISTKVFRSFRFGMWNIHHERLPLYPNCQPVFWSVYHRETITGWTIHRIDSGIDTGEILLQGHIPIKWRKSLRATINDTFKELLEDSTEGLLRLLNDGAIRTTNVVSQERWHTTPRITQIILTLIYNKIAWYRYNK